MSKEPKSTLATLKVNQLKKVLKQLEVEFDPSLEREALAELVAGKLPEGKMVNEEGEVVDKTDDIPAATETAKLKTGEVRLKENVKFNGKYYQKGSVVQVTDEEADMLRRQSLVD